MSFVSLELGSNVYQIDYVGITPGLLHYVEELNASSRIGPTMLSFYCRKAAQEISTEEIH